MKSVYQQLEEYSALFELALSGDLDAQQEIDAILRKVGSGFIEQVRALDRMESQINDPVKQRIEKTVNDPSVKNDPVLGIIQDIPYADARRLVIARWLNAPIEPGSEQRGKAGRKTDSLYDQAFEKIGAGTKQNEARQWFFEQAKITPDEAAIKAFNTAMRRRRKATK